MEGFESLREGGSCQGYHVGVRGSTEKGSEGSETDPVWGKSSRRLWGPDLELGRRMGLQ